MATNAPRPGTRDEHYGLVSMLYHVRQGADTGAMYLSDAEQAGDQDLVQCCREGQGTDRQLADRGKTLPRQCLREANARQGCPP